MKSLILPALKQLAKGIACEFGENCEVVIHDISKVNENSSIIYIEHGKVSGRKIGDGPSEAVMDAFRNHDKELSDRYAYLTQTSDGRVIKSTTIYIRDERNKPIYVFAVNFDITTLLAFEGSIKSLTETSDSAGKEPQHIVTDVSHLLDDLIAQSVAMIGKPVSYMTKEDKIRAIQYLNDSGAFLITKSGDKVAKHFGISKYTLYSYVDINK